MTPLNAEILSALLLELTHMCHRLSVEAFRRDALGAIARCISADVGWAGFAAELDEGYKVHSSYQFGLPEGCEELLNLTHADNVVGGRCRAAPGDALSFGPRDLYGNIGTAVLATHMNVKHVVAVARPDPRLGQLAFLSFGRKDEGRAFGDVERRLVQLVMPHLIELQGINFLMQIASWRNSRFQYQEGLAVADSDALVHAADPVFVRLLAEESPGWIGPRLPEAMAGGIAAGAEEVSGARVTGQFLRMGKLTVVTLRERSALDALGRREREVAMAFASGDSYKEVARRLDIAPATVRHHLRNIYEKLGISDKAALAQLVK